MKESLRKNEILESGGIHHSMCEPWKHYAQWNNPDRKRPCSMWLHLYEISRRGTLIETRQINGYHRLVERKLCVQVLIYKDDMKRSVPLKEKHLLWDKFSLCCQVDPELPGSDHALASASQVLRLHIHTVIPVHCEKKTHFIHSFSMKWGPPSNM